MVLRLGLGSRIRGKLARTKGLSLRETAERMGWSHTQVWILEGRAAEKIRAALTEDTDKGGEH